MEALDNSIFHTPSLVRLLIFSQRLLLIFFCLFGLYVHSEQQNVRPWFRETQQKESVTLCYSADCF